MPTNASWPSTGQRLVLLAPAILNLGACYLLFPAHPLVALVNGALALVMLAILAATWRTKP